MNFYCYLCDNIFLLYPELDNHLQRVHKLNKKSTNLNLKCVANKHCKNVYCSFQSLKRHSLNCKNAVNGDVSNTDSETIHMNNINFSHMDNFNSSNSENTYNRMPFMSQTIDSLISGFENLSEKKTDEIIIYFRNIIENIFTEVSTSVIENRPINKMLENIDSLKRKYLSDLDTLRTTHKRKKQIDDSKYFVAPTAQSIGLNFNVNDKITIRQNTFQYVSIIKSIQCLFQNSSFYESYFKNEHVCRNDYFQKYCCGQNFKSNNLYLKHPDALQLQIYYDDFELCNPLGSKRKIHKLGAIYLNIKNLPAKTYSNLNNMILVALFKTVDIKQSLSYDSFLRPLIDELKILETEGILINGEKRIFGTLTSLSHDNLAANQLLGFVGSFRSTHFCRFCLAARTNTETMISEDESLLRNLENYKQSLREAIEIETHVNGIKSTTLFNELKYFDIINNCSADAMHDILEGVGPFFIKEFFKFMIVEKLLSLSEINDRIMSFNYGYLFKKVKPTPINLTFVSLSASQCWCLLLHIPFIFSDFAFRLSLKIKWLAFEKLLRIMSIVFSDKLNFNDIQTLRVLISDHLSLLLQEFKVKLIPKHHFLIHYPSIILKMGPLYHLWTMRYESKNSFFKQIAQRTKNFKNILHTLTFKHQRHMALIFKKNFLDHQVKLGKCTKKLSKTDSVVIKYRLDCELNMYKYYENGYHYRPGLFIIENSFNKPTFNRIDFVASTKETDIILLCEKYETVEFSNFHNGYQIKATNQKQSFHLKALENKLSFEGVVSRNNNIYIISNSKI